MRINYINHSNKLNIRGYLVIFLTKSIFISLQTQRFSHGNEIIIIKEFPYDSIDTLTTKMKSDLVQKKKKSIENLELI